MSMDPTEIEELLARPLDAVLSVVLPSGRAMGTPVWFRWVAGVARFQSPTTSAKTRALRRSGRASLCVHEHRLPVARYVTLEGPVREVAFDLDADIGAAARHYLGDGAPDFLARIDDALSSGRRWASFELLPVVVTGRSQLL